MRPSRIVATAVLAAMFICPVTARGAGALYPPVPFGPESGVGLPPKMEQAALDIVRRSSYYRAIQRFDDGYWTGAFRWTHGGKVLGAQAVFHQDVGYDFAGSWLWLRHCPAGSKRAYLSIPYRASYRELNGFIADVDLAHHRVVGFQPDRAADPQTWQAGPARFIHLPTLAGACG